jgi:chromate reductase, NAD(P)H dehydrogenase (quinone)
MDKLKIKKVIFVLIGSAAKHSSNGKLAENLAGFMSDDFSLHIFKDLKHLPHFDPELSVDGIPAIILDLRNNIEKADGVIICTPEYVFGVPAGLKNALEWCVSTTVFTGKPLGIITASAQGTKGHEQLQLIMKTLMAEFTGDTSLLITGIKGRMNGEGEISDQKTKDDLARFVTAFGNLVRDAGSA